MSMMKTRPLGQYVFYCICVAMVLLLVVLPLTFIAIKAVTVPSAGSWKITVLHLQKVIGGELYWNAVWNTVFISFMATAVAGAIGVPLGWLFARTDLPGSRILESLSTLPILIPPFVGAVAWILLAAPQVGAFNNLFVRGGFEELLNVYTHSGIAWVMGLYLAPYVMMILAGALRSMDPSLEEAGQMCGFNWLKTAQQITLPLVLPAILSGLVLSFSIAIGLFGTPLVLGWSKQILMLTSRIWVASQKVPPDYGVMAVLALYLMGLSSISMYAQQRLLGGRSFITVTGKGFRAQTVTLGRLRILSSGLVWIYVFLTIFGPIAILLCASLSTYTWSGLFTLGNVTSMLSSSDVWFTLKNSIFISVFSAIAATIIGIGLSWITCRTRLPGRHILEYIVLMPISVPGIAFGIGVMWLWLSLPLPIYGTAWIIVMAFVGRFTSYAVRSISAGVIQVHPELEESARISGYGWLRTLGKITLPLIRPNILASWILLFSFCSTELSMVVMLYTAKSRMFSVLSFEIWSMGDFSQLASLSLLQLLLGMSVIYVARIVSGETRLKVWEKARSLPATTAGG